MDNNLFKQTDIAAQNAPYRQIDTLLSIILDAAMQLSRCRAGTIYNRKGEMLCFRLVRNLDMPELEQVPDTLPPVPMGSRANLCTLAAAEGRTLHIPDAYADTPSAYDVSGLRDYDSRTGYHSHSVLVCPIMNEGKDCMAVLQLINARSADGAESDFTQSLASVEKLAESVADALPIFRLLSERDRFAPQREISEDLNRYLQKNFYGGLSPRELQSAAGKNLILPETVRFKLARMEQDRQNLNRGASPRGSSALSYGLPGDTLDFFHNKPQPANAVLNKCIDLAQRLNGRRFSALDANMEKSTLSRLRNGRMAMSRKYLFAILITLRLPMEQVDELMRAYGMCFSGCDQRDLVVQYYLQQLAEKKSKISVALVNIELNNLGLEPLGSQLLENEI